jgi:long-chain acyl-CoA synthetase
MIISGDRSISYPDIMQRIAKAATGFKALGAGEAAPVAMMLRNDFALFETAFGAGAIGARIVPINWHLKGEEVGYILADSGAKLLVCHADLLPQIADGLPKDLSVLIVRTPPEIAAAYGVAEAATGVPAGATDFDLWREQQVPMDNPPKRALTMFYTSGTTGRPKGVKRGSMTPEQAAASERVGAIAYGLKPDNQIVLMNGPMYHSAPSSYGLMAFRHGSTIVLEPRFDPEDLLQLVEQHRVTNMHMVPTMFVRLLRLPDDAKSRYDLSSLRNVIHGAAPCPVHVKQAMIKWWGLVINEYLGSTETGVPIWHSSEEALKKPGTVGRTIEGGVVRIYRPDGTQCDVGEPGEIYMRQTSVPDFDYQGRPEARAEAGRDGLISVGDVGYLDEDGYLFMCDRKRDMVISGGVNIYPAEIESTLIGMDGIRDCAMFGVPDDEFGERLVGCVEIEDGLTISSADIQAYLKQRLANFKVPKEIHFLDALPRESTGKIFKRKLRDQYAKAAA